MHTIKKYPKKGFTLIELVIVIVVLVVLAAIAIPKYLSLMSEAKQATVESYAGALASAAATNHALCQANSKSPNCIQDIKNCKDFTKLLADTKSLPSGIKIEDVGQFPMGKEQVAECKISYGKNTFIQFRALLP